MPYCEHAHILEMGPEAGDCPVETLLLVIVFDMMIEKSFLIDIEDRMAVNVVWIRLAQFYDKNRSPLKLDISIFKTLLTKVY